VGDRSGFLTADRVHFASAGGPAPRPDQDGRASRAVRTIGWALVEAIENMLDLRAKLQQLGTELALG